MLQPPLFHISAPSVPRRHSKKVTFMLSSSSQDFITMAEGEVKTNSCPLRQDEPHLFSNIQTTLLQPSGSESPIALTLVLEEAGSDRLESSVV